jgi:hypothetical protein
MLFLILSILVCVAGILRLTVFNGVPLPNRVENFDQVDLPHQCSNCHKTLYTGYVAMSCGWFCDSLCLINYDEARTRDQELNLGESLCREHLKDLPGDFRLTD